jgi:CheY-like chemotaxis protein
MQVGDVLAIDASGVEVFDFSFAAELFGKTVATLGAEYPGRFLIVEGLTDCTRENLNQALEGSNLLMIGHFLPFKIAAPCYAFSYEQAVSLLDGSKVFHVVILDLRLPEKQGLPEVQDLDLGLDLLERCINRDRFPIPALLVISGHVGSTDQVRIQDRLRENFFYARLLAKGDFALLETAIKRARTEALRYAGIGIHLRDAGEEQYPTLTPRDEDLLRRSVLQQQGGIGVDLDWWSATRHQLGAAVEANPWTKVLMGRYLLDEGGGASRPKFFKLLAGADSHSVIESARRIEQKLTHIKITSTVVSKSTGLIVTEKVGAQDERPKPLSEIFKIIDRKGAFEIAGQIVSQVHQLGELLDDSKPLKSRLWPYHDEQNLRDQWKDLQQRLSDPVPRVDPIELYHELLQSDQKVRLRERPIVHGDLHMSNVALDRTPRGHDAYIFDAGVIRRSTAGRDLAVLEVSTLRHQRLEFDTLIHVCSVIYDVSTPLDENTFASVTDPLAQNIIEFVRGLRTGVSAWNPPEIYALLVFDFALIQLRGLRFGTSGNLIADPRAAGAVAAFVARWYGRIRKGGGA